jgi:signal transduction histidine kinase
MDTFEKELAKIQRRDWQMWILMLTVFLIFTAFIVLVIFYSDLQRLYEEQIDVRMFNFLLLGFVALSLLFIGYVVLKEMSIKKLQKDLMAEQVDSQTLQRRMMELQAVQELTSVVNSEMMLSELFDTITSKAIRALDADQCSLFLYDPEISKLRCVSVWGPRSDRVKEAVIEVGKSVAGWVIENGTPLFLNGEPKGSQFREVVKKDKKITSSLCLPLKVADETKGVLNVSIFENRREFTQSDLKLATRFAEQAVIAIDKAGLYEKLKKQTKTLKNIIKDMRATQGQFIEPDTLRALSNLANGMAHDFKKTLTTISERTRCVLEEFGEMSLPDNAKKQDMVGWLKTIDQLAAEGMETANNVQAFARTFQASPEKDSEELDLNVIIREVVEHTRPKWEDQAREIRMEVRTDLPKLPNLVGNRSEIKDVLTSMIYNSIDALPDGGDIIVKTAMRDDKVEIQVKDNGTGMSEEVKKRVFEPFFTTKAEAGHGIGLSVAHGIISRHSGQMSAESEPGKGTTITITLPVGGKPRTAREKTGEPVEARPA